MPHYVLHIHSEDQCILSALAMQQPHSAATDNQDSVIGQVGDYDSNTALILPALVIGHHQPHHHVDIH